MKKPAPSLKGKLLLDSGMLSGSSFDKTVLLICEHNAEGALGLVLNRPVGRKVGEVIDREMGEALRNHPVYLGGPVQTQVLSWLQYDEFLPDANVMENLKLGHALEELAEVTEGYSSTCRVKVFAGYAGWSPGQLDEELSRGSWLVSAAKMDVIFDVGGDGMWRGILRTMGIRQQLLADRPDHPEWN
ncbi:MAG: YqgE/AlgH family protein [Verrucomicrobiae bacterium]|nr:YqgE/AlgH family protein [Verrucomicrobiae bacterium]